MRLAILRIIAVALLATVISPIGATPKAAADHVETNWLTVYQGNLTAWVNAVGADAVAAELANTDILAISHANAHDEGGSEWPNNPPSRGCNDGDQRDALIEVLSRVKNLSPSTLIFGYVSGPADAPDQGGLQAHCGNNVNNYGAPGATTFTACPQDICLNFVHWVNDWLPGPDELGDYIDGIFIDFVTSVHMTPVIRDNVYSYINALGLRIMVNTTLPGAPCPGCVNNYAFAADSIYLDNNDYILVEGYYANGCSIDGCPGGVAQLRIAETQAIAGIRDQVAANHGGVRPRLAALVTEPPNAAFSQLLCSFSDYTNARDIFHASAVAGDAISFQFADLGIIDNNLDGIPDKPLVFCD